MTFSSASSKLLAGGTSLTNRKHNGDDHMFNILDHNHATRGPNVTSVNHNLRAVGESFLSKPFSDWRNLNKYCLSHEKVTHVQTFCKQLKKAMLLTY